MRRLNGTLFVNAALAGASYEIEKKPISIVIRPASQRVLLRGQAADSPWVIASRPSLP
jgi:hypothetical protein